MSDWSSGAEMRLMRLSGSVTSRSSPATSVR